MLSSNTIRVDNRITYTVFKEALRTCIDRFSKHDLNPEQNICVETNSESLMIIAGPGSGKTTVLVLRALKYVYCDNILPEQILITTFTKKAAEEIRSRLIEWGLTLHEYFKDKFKNDKNASTWLSSIDLNRFITGTLDGICEEVLSTYSQNATFKYSIVEKFVGNGLLRRYGIMPRRASVKSDNFKTFLEKVYGSAEIYNDSDLISYLRPLIDRFIMDKVDLSLLAQSNPNKNEKMILVDLANSYWSGIKSDYRLDFPLLELLFLDSLKNDSIQRFTKSIKVALLDEYQDTNPLQEEIYFTLIEKSSAKLTVVGDDDQSLYRFRGATVELFKKFKERYELRFKSSVEYQYLIENYRSSAEIVSFFNEYILGLSSFQSSRVQPPKPLIKANRAKNNIPILGLFRDTPSQLSTDLGKFLGDVFSGNGFQVQNGEDSFLLKKSDLGNFGDSVFLSHSVNEYAKYMGSARERLPLLLRHELVKYGCSIFNPRGRELRDIPEVKVILGLLLECLDGESSIQTSAFLLNDARRYFDIWRQDARSFIATNPSPSEPHTLRNFVIAWQRRQPQGNRERWPNNLPALELLFKLITWIPFFKTDPEGQVYLEAIARAITQSSGFSSYEGKLIFTTEHESRSIKAFITDILGAIATNEIDIDEEIMPSIPRDRLPVMTIHQSKGLEFPLVIADIASDYKTNHSRQRQRRFPDSGSNVTVLENYLSEFSGDIGEARLERDEVQRTFDDLCRLYYVAYSRAKSALILVGLTNSLEYNTKIQNVATGWDLSGSWSWRKDVAGRKKPGMANNIPLVLI